MNEVLESVDPVWAWQTYKPSAEMPWNRTRAAHLYRRAGFGANWRELDEALNEKPAELVRQIVSQTEDEAFHQQAERLMQSIVAGNDGHRLSAGWMHRMLHTPAPLLEKMTLFWHGHFATSGEKVTDTATMLTQHRILRKHALGDFAAMVQDISHDPAMLLYLDSATNRKAHPNENFSRELMELFCLGLGNYTEKDIQELARCFTGWEIRQNDFKFNPYQADTGEKVILGRSGKFSGEDGIGIVLDQPAAPQFVVGKLIRFFVADDVAIPNKLIQPLADELRAANFKISVVVERILSSQLFFSELAIGRRIRSPIELGIGLLRSLEATMNLQRLSLDCAQLGQELFFPPNVKGWDGGRTWINSSTLLGRGNLVRRMISDNQARFSGGNLAAMLRRYNAESPEQIVDWLLELLVAVPVSNATRQTFLELARQSPGRCEPVIQALGILPEFQLC